MASTIADIAQKTALAPSTIYDILAKPDHPGYPLATRNRVLRVSKELRYVPYAAARALRTRRTDTIGILVGKVQFSPEQAGGFFADLLPGLGIAAARLGYHVLLEVELDADPQKGLNLCRELIRSGRVDGMVISGSAKGDPRLDILGSANVPFVVIGKTYQEGKFDVVDNDNVAVARLATQHLLDLGHRRIACLTDPADYVTFRDRRLGYYETMKAAGIDPKDLPAYSEGFTPGLPAEEAVEKLWSFPQPPTAILAYDDVSATGMVQALNNRGLNVPGDVSVMGINDDMICQRMHPELTTIRLNVRRLGEEAARLLISRIEDPDHPIRYVTVPCELIVRKSSARLSQANNGKSNS